MVCQGRVGHVGGKCAGLGRVVRWIFRSFCFDEINSENDEKCSYGEFLDVGWWGRIQVVTMFPGAPVQYGDLQVVCWAFGGVKFRTPLPLDSESTKTVSALKCDTQ